ncbi:MAG: outer membrane beta-barrel protein [Bacteroidales bacterium]|nr:outer membrane beta-barrel protein [Bacteroidales bacterium]
MKPFFSLLLGLSLSGVLRAQKDYSLPEAKAKSTHWLIRQEANKSIYQLSVQGDVAGSDLLHALRLLPALSIEPEGIRWEGQIWPELAVDGRMVRLIGNSLEDYLRSLPADEVKAIELVHNTMGEFSTPADYVLNVRLHSPRSGHLSGFNTLSTHLQGFISEQLNGRFAYANRWLDADLNYGASQQRGAKDVRINQEHEEEWVAPRHEGWGKVHVTLRFSPNHTLGLGGNYLKTQEDLKYSHGARAAFEEEGWAGQAHYLLRTPRFTLRLEGEGQHRQSRRYYRKQAKQLLPYRDDQTTMGAALAEATWHIAPDWRIRAGINAHYNQYQAVLVRPYTGRINPEFSWQEWRATPQLQLVHQGRKSTVVLGMQLALDSVQAYQSTGIMAAGALHVQPLPYALLSYRPHEAHHIETEWASTLTRPPFRQLNNGASLNGTLFVAEGNAQLRSTTTHQLSLRYIYRNATFLEWKSAYVEQPWIQELSSGKAADYRLRPINWTSLSYTQFSAHVPFYLVQRQSWSWRTDLYGFWRWQEDFDRRTKGNFTRQSSNYLLQVKEILTLPGRWSADVGASYRSSHYWGEWQVEPQWWLSAGLAKHWKNWRIALTIHDPLHTQVQRLSKGENAPIKMHINEFTPRLALGITWRWGSGRRRPATLLDADRQRLQHTGKEGFSLP